MLDPERVGESTGGIDRDHARVPAAPRAFEREHRRGRGLAHAAGPATDDDAPVVDELVDADRHSRSIPRANASASSVELRACDVGIEDERQHDLRQRQTLAEPFDLFVLQRVPLFEERGRVREVVGFALRDETVGHARVGEDRVGVGRHPHGQRLKQPLTTTGPSATPARSSIANAVSTTSLTGVSSASVTSIT